MQRIINEEITKTIDMDKLRKIIPSYCRVVRYDALKNKKTLADVMGKYECLIILFNIHDEKHRLLNVPGHFFLLSTRGPEPCVVFSSTGMTPKKELFVTHSDPSLFERVLPKGTVYNNVKFQITKDSNTCWRWTIAYAHLAKWGLKKFQATFRRPSLTITRADQLVTLLTYLSLQ